MKACLLLVRDIVMHENTWEGQHADEMLIEAMQPWLSGKGCPALVDGFPDDFLGLWTMHIHSKMFYKLTGNIDSMKVFEEVTKRKF